jgi:hypothetical protein
MKGNDKKCTALILPVYGTLVTFRFVGVCGPRFLGNFIKLSLDYRVELALVRPSCYEAR